MKPINKQVLSFLSLGVVFLLATANVFAGSMSFSPSSKSVATGATFDVNVTVDGGLDKILGADVVIKYDSALLDVEKIEQINTENFLSFARERHNVPGQIYIAAIVTDPAQEISGKGDVAKITFRAKGTSSSTTNVVFECQPGQTAGDSNISQNSIDVKDIIVCSENVPLAVTIGTGTGTGAITASPVPTVGLGTPTRVPTRPVVVNPPANLPRTGALEDMLGIALPGVALLLAGVFARRYLA